MRYTEYMQTNQSSQAPTPITPNTQPTNAPPATQTPPTPTLKTKKPWLLISLVVFLLSATGVLGYKYYQVKQQLNNQPPTSLPSPQLVISSPSPVVSPATEVDPTAGWKTYIPQNKLFSIKYPQEWEVKPEVAPNQVRVVTFDTKQVAEEIKPTMNMELFISYHKNITNFEDWLLENQAGKIISSKTIKGNQFFVVSGGAMYKSLEYAVEISNNNFLRFVIEPFTDSSPSQNSIDILETILSTFVIL